MNKRSSAVPAEGLGRLINLGPTSAGWLKAVGISNLDDLKSHDPVDLYATLKHRGYPASLNLVYAIRAAIMGIHWTALPAEIRDELKVAVRVRNLELEQP